MTDRELLEFAAKAAEIDVVRSRLNDPACADMLINNSPRNVDQRSGPWNPLTDDGDALRLAVKLRMNVNIYTTRTAVTAEEFFDDVFHKDDPLAATRSAIVHAAAEIGKAMP